MDKVFLFPGYGAQYVGMGKDFYDHYRCVQELFEEASNCLNINFVKLCFASSEKELSKPANAYLALFVLHAALYSVLLEHGVEPSLITGWGVGCVSMYHAAGVINFPDGLYVLGKYLAFLQELVCDKSLAAARVNGILPQELEKLLQDQKFSDVVMVGFVCAERESIVVGESASVCRLRALLVDMGCVVVDEPLAYALHILCRHEMVKRMNAYLVKIDIKLSRYPFLDYEGLYIAVDQPFQHDRLTRFMYSVIDVPRAIKQIGVCQTLIQIGPSFLNPAQIKTYLPQARVIGIIQRKDLKGIIS